MIFGFLLTICLIPGIIGAGTSTRWALAAMMLPVLAALSPGQSRGFTTSHLFGLLFIWYAAISLSWSAGQYDGIDALVKLGIVACAFVYGSRLDSLRCVIIGFGLGIWVNSAVIVSGVVVPNLGDNTGLFINSNSMGEIAGLVLVAAGVHRLWWLVPGILPAFIMANCRGAFVAVAGAGIWWLWRRSAQAERIALIVVVLILGALYVPLLGGGSAIALALVPARLRNRLVLQFVPASLDDGHAGSKAGASAQ